MEPPATGCQRPAGQQLDAQRTAASNRSLSPVKILPILGFTSGPTPSDGGEVLNTAMIAVLRLRVNPEEGAESGLASGVSDQPVTVRKIREEVTEPD